MSALLPGNGLLIGEFTLGDGRTAIVIQNQNWGQTPPCPPPPLTTTIALVLGMFLRECRWLQTLPCGQ